MKNINLKEIEKQIRAYHEMVFSNDETDFKYNKIVKLNLQDYIIASKNDNKVIGNALLILAKATGCADDQIIADEMIDFLVKNQILNQNQCDFFFENCSTARWD